MFGPTRFDRELTDIFAVQDELTEKITSALKIKLTQSERALLASGGTKNADAHDLLLKGRELIMGNQRNREVFEQSVACFRRALELDPNYAAPYAGLGMAYMLDHQNHWSEKAETSLDEAQRFIAELHREGRQGPLRLLRRLPCGLLEEGPRAVEGGGR